MSEATLEKNRNFSEKYSPMIVSLPIKTIYSIKKTFVLLWRPFF